MLQIKSLSKSYNNQKLAVDCIDLVVNSGDIFGFIGHNGAGKTTTLRCISGILDFTQGEILIDGISVKKDPVATKRITAFLPDNPDMYEFLTGIKYLNFICDIYEVDTDTRNRLISQYADIFELTPALGSLISSYSHGMKQKLALISALVRSPRLLLLDEPFVGLDPKAAHSLKTIMTEFCSAGGALFFSTHVLEVAQKLCNKIAIISDGKIVVSGKTDEVIGDKSLEDVFLSLTERE